MNSYTTSRSFENYYFAIRNSSNMYIFMIIIILANTLEMVGYFAWKWPMTSSY